MFRVLTSKRAAFQALLYAIYGVVCSRIPPFDTLGYEFAALTGLVTALGGGLLFPAAGRTLSSNAGISEILGPFIDRVVLHTVLLLIPLCLLTVNALFVPNCSMLSGLVFFVLIPVISVVFVTALGFVVSSLLPGWTKVPVYVLIVFLLLLHPVLLVLTQPQLFAYNHLFGLFVGFSWDEAQPSVWTLLLYRLTTLAYAALMTAGALAIRMRGAFLTGPRTIRTRVAAACALAFTTIIWGYLMSDSLGFTTSGAHLRSELSGRFETTHFTIHYRPGSVNEAEIRRIGEEHEFRLWQVTRILQVPGSGRFHSFLYPDRETKRRLLGTESSQIARPWMREMHLSQDGLDHALKHEIVHLVAAEFGPYVVRAPVLNEFGLTEGLAMAVEWEYGNRTLHQYAAALLAYDMLPASVSLMSTSGFLGGSSSLGYVASGSFCRWIMDVKGVEVLKDAYRRDDIPAATGKSHEELDREWRAFLRTVPREQPDSLASLYSFRGVSVLKKICARALTEANRRASEAFVAGRFDSALSLYRASDRLRPNPRAVFGQASSLMRLGRDKEVLVLTGSVLGDSLRAYSLVPLLLWQGDAAWKSGDSSLAATSYETLIRERPSGWPVEAATRRFHALRRPHLRDMFFRIFDREMMSGADGDSLHAVNRSELRAAFKGDSTDLLLRLMLAGSLAEDSSAVGEAILLLNGSKGEAFRDERQLLLGKLLLATGDVAGARRIFTVLLESTDHEVRRWQARDELERCDWIETGSNVSGRTS